MSSSYSETIKNFISAAPELLRRAKDSTVTYVQQNKIKTAAGVALVAASPFMPIALIGALGMASYWGLRRDTDEVIPWRAMIPAFGASLMIVLPMAFLGSSARRDALEDVWMQINDCPWKGEATKPYTEFSYWAYGSSEKQYTLREKTIDCQGKWPDESYMTVELRDNRGNVWTAPRHVMPPQKPTPKGYEGAKVEYWLPKP